MSAENSGRLPEKAAIIANPVAGGGRGKKHAEQVKWYLEKENVEAEIIWTNRSGEATGIAQEQMAKGVRLIGGCGGDGTLNEVANALADTDAIMGVLPGGRGNDLVRALDIPRHPIQAADIFLHGHCRTIDLARVGDRYFNTIATLGFDAEVCRTVMENRMPFSGPATYLYAVMKTLVNFRAPMVRLSGDFGVYEGKIFLAATCNSSMYGGGMKIAPPARIDDGILHVCVIEEISRLMVLRLLRLVYFGEHVRHPAVKIFPTRSLKIETPDEAWIFADGEFMTKTPATIEIAESTLKVMAPLELGQ